jgi:hypothetical protein
VGGDISGAPLDDLPMTAKKEQFSLGYVRMVASAAGCSVKEHTTDYDGVDITIASSAEYELFYCPQFELQLKCTSQKRVLRDDHIVWTMESAPFRRLINPKRMIPAYLGVLYVPGESETWLDQDEERLWVNGRMYWQCAARLGVASEGRGTKTIRLPRSNLFDADQLLGIMKTVGEGGDW